MTAPATEKAAPIPAEVLALAERFGADIACQRAITAALMQDRADRASQEERIREDEREPDDLTEDEIRDRAKAVIRDCGWLPGARPGLHSVCEMMVRFGMALTQEPATARCNHPECGCDHDAMCRSAVARLRGDAS